MDGKQFARRFGRVHQKDIPVNDLPSIALLESVHSFPGPYVFKVIGRNELGFVARAVAAVREELGSEQDPPYRVRESRSLSTSVRGSTLGPPSNSATSWMRAKCSMVSILKYALKTSSP